MTSELVAAGCGRIIVPTIARIDYLAALRRLSRDRDPSMLPQVLYHLWRFTDRVDFTRLDVATGMLERANAFVDAVEAERAGIHLLMPPTRATLILDEQ